MAGLWGPDKDEDSSENEEPEEPNPCQRNSQQEDRSEGQGIARTCLDFPGL